jgi:hypothetical protein
MRVGGALLLRTKDCGPQILPIQARESDRYNCLRAAFAAW